MTRKYQNYMYDWHSFVFVIWIARRWKALCSYLLESMQKYSCRKTKQHSLPSYNSLLCAGNQPEGLNWEKVNMLQETKYFFVMVLLEELSEEGGGKGSSTLVMTYNQGKASSWALEVTPQYFSWCMGNLVCFRPLTILREYQHQTTCAQAGWPRFFCAAHRTRVLGVESSLYLLGFTWTVVMSWVLDRSFMSFRFQQL